MRIIDKFARAIRLPPDIFLFYLALHGKKVFRSIWFFLRLPALDWTHFFISSKRALRLKKSARTRFFFSPDDRDRIVESLRRAHPLYIQEFIGDAEAICRHEFDLLGSGSKNLGANIPWTVDWIHGKVWPNTVRAQSDPLSISGKGELKLPWELSRFYHAVTLGQAYWLTNSEKYAKEFMAQVVDWERCNPMYRSVNWSNAMEVSIRLANLLMGWMFFLNSPSLTDTFHVRFLRLAWCHAHFIMHNLERGVIRGNHYFSDLLGVIYFSILCPELPRMRRWGTWCLREFEREVQHQFYEDGTNFEASIPYHRLTTEITQLVVLLCRIQNIPLRATTIERLKTMCEFTLWYTKPNGYAPQIGDNDNGRIHPFDGLVGSEINDHRHLLSVAAYLFPDHLEFRSYISHSSAPLWLCEKISTPPAEKSQSLLTSRAFPLGGIYILRSGNDYCIVDIGGPGQDGVGGHSHNDALSFELCLRGEDLIVDPGTYVYTSDPDARNFFRSTAMHNTVQIDHEEMNPVGERLFELIDHARPRLLYWLCDNDRDILEAKHEGYRRLHKGVVHRRKFVWQKHERILIIDDVFEGEGEHIFEWFFHIASDVQVDARPSAIKLTTARGNSYTITIEGGGGLLVEDSWISPSYGVRIAAPVVVRKLRGFAGLSRYRTIITPSLQ